MAKINSITTNTKSFTPTKEFTNSSNLNKEAYLKLKNKSAKNNVKFWANLASKHLTWYKKFTHTLNKDKAPFYKWFEDGKINASYNCLDRHLEDKAHKTAIISISDAGQTRLVTYKELYSMTCKFSNGLTSLGLKRGDRVVIYLPHSIEAVVAMQACARLGLIHSVVFAGFSAKSLSDRIIDATAKVIITADSFFRGGKETILKTTVDEALAVAACAKLIKNVVVLSKSGTKVKWQNGRDIWWHDLINNQKDRCKAVKLSSEHPLFILYTSGSTGTPKGVQHSTAGYLLGTIMSLKWVFDMQPNDIFWCTADVGWITGHSYVCYGPLAVGATQIIFEGTPTYPDPSRFWEIIDKFKVTIFYTAPTAIRTLIKLGSNIPDDYNLSSLRLLGSVGEPINPEAWLWYYNKIGRKKCPIVDTWWQTETGSVMMAPIPGVTALKPGSCTMPLPGIEADIIDESGRTLANNATGYLVIKNPFPSQIRTIWNNKERFINAYYPKEIGKGEYYVAGDSAHKDKDGYFWILGRIDDVLNVSGHRLGTMEIESVLVSHQAVAEAAVVAKKDEIKGESIVAFVVCKGTNVKLKQNEQNQLEQDLRKWVAKIISPIAQPDRIVFTENLPKTRSGKIMRRLLKSIANGEDISQDISTLENPHILEQLKLKK
jgi:acetyl-CoA synthetase